ncbi:MAG: prolipoprotein diacylglyceryl transferase [Candidatus Falkowbacteria bacterium]
MNINFLHTWPPTRLALVLGPLHIYWYGLLMVLAILASLFALNRLARLAKWRDNLVIDLAFYLVISALIGARLYHVAVQWAYYSHHLNEIPAIWQGGLAIHGAVLAGALTLYLFARRHAMNFRFMTAALAGVLPLGQAIGRWGNYFNQELFGRPTNLPWGIPIEPVWRGAAYQTASYFHPVFLYESLADLLLFLILWQFAKRALAKNSKPWANLAIAGYIAGYSMIRFLMESLRVDYTPLVLGLRWPQVVSLFFIAFALVWYVWQQLKVVKAKTTDASLAK